MNGIAGAYAEHVPIVNIVGMPAISAQEKHKIIHHTLGNGKDYDVFMQMYSKISAAQTQLTVANAAVEIDRVLELCWLRKRPCYIGIPSNLFGKEIEINMVAFFLAYPTSDPDKLKEAAYHYSHQPKVEEYKVSNYIATKKKLTQTRFWQQIEAYLCEGDILIPEAGTSLFGALC